jgi:hypothetical protein
MFICLDLSPGFILDSLGPERRLEEQAILCSEAVRIAQPSSANISSTITFGERTPLRLVLSHRLQR